MDLAGAWLMAIGAVGDLDMANLVDAGLNGGGQIPDSVKRRLL